MSVKLVTEHHLKFLSLKEGCTGSSESTLVKMSNRWKSRAAAQLDIERTYISFWFLANRRPVRSQMSFLRSQKQCMGVDYFTH